jgi:hypothetical protein
MQRNQRLFAREIRLRFGTQNLLHRYFQLTDSQQILANTVALLAFFATPYILLRLAIACVRCTVRRCRGQYIP